MTDAVIPAQDAGGITLGQTHLDAGDLIIPRVKIIQAMSAEKDPKGENGIPVNEGDWWDTLRSVSYGDVLRFAPIQTFKQRVFLVRADKGRDEAEAMLPDGLSEGDGLKCRSYDMEHGIGEPGMTCAACPLSRWREDNKPPLCTETYNIAAVTGQTDADPGGELIVLSFGRSSARVGKQLFSLIRLNRGLAWAFSYDARTKEEKGQVGRYFVPVVTRSGATPPEVQSAAEYYARVLIGRTIDVTPPDEPGEEAPTGAAPWDDPAS